MSTSDASDLLGVDLSEHAARAVVVDPTGRVTGRASGACARPAEIADIARAAAREAGLARPRLVGVAIGGEATPADVKTVVTSLQRAWDGATPVHTVAWGAAYALGEFWCGAARGATNVVAFSLGEQVSAGLILDGRLWTGSHDLAGSVAWLALNPVEREDYRKLGCLEAEVGSSGIVRRLVWRIKAGDHSRVLDAAGGDLSAVTLDHVLAGARDGDGVAISVIRDTVKYLGMAVANLAATVDPEVVVLGGTVHAAGDLLLEPIRTEAARRMPPAAAAAVRIELAALGAEAPAFGAARYALDHHS
jgi:glucokinase